ncbi:hypothetical protein ZWY2020_036055 [Hordeum vulgare]|nr:hypothetical protein ZWY2020_036055 [Hordeum vulgare]
MARGPRRGRAPPRPAVHPVPRVATGHPLSALRATDAIIRTHPRHLHFRVCVQAADSVHDACEMWRLLRAQKDNYVCVIVNLEPLEKAADLRLPINEGRLRVGTGYQGGRTGASNANDDSDDLS